MSVLSDKWIRRMSKDKKMISVFLNRVFRAIKIDIELYEEVEKDKSATFQA